MADFVLNKGMMILERRIDDLELSKNLGRQPISVWTGTTMI